MLEINSKYNELKFRSDKLNQTNIKLIENNEKLQNATKTYFINNIRSEHNYF